MITESWQPDASNREGLYLVGLKIDGFGRMVDNRLRPVGIR
jgi:hypothetical protein